MIDDLDRSLVTPGLPDEPGLHLLWWDHNGWPAIAIVYVHRMSDGSLVWSKLGSGGTDRWHEIPSLFGFPHDKYLGQSVASPKALAHFEALRRRISCEISRAWASNQRELQ